MLLKLYLTVMYFDLFGTGPEELVTYCYRWNACASKDEAAFCIFERIFWLRDSDNQGIIRSMLICVPQNPEDTKITECD